MYAPPMQEGQQPRTIDSNEEVVSPGGGRRLRHQRDGCTGNSSHDGVVGGQFRATVHKLGPGAANTRWALASPGYAAQNLLSQHDCDAVHTSILKPSLAKPILICDSEAIRGRRSHGQLVGNKAKTRLRTTTSGTATACKLRKVHTWRPKVFARPGLINVAGHTTTGEPAPPDVSTREAMTCTHHPR